MSERKEYQKQYRLQNKDKMNEYHKNYYHGKKNNENSGSISGTGFMNYFDKFIEKENKKKEEEPEEKENKKSEEKPKRKYVFTEKRQAAFD